MRATRRPFQRTDFNVIPCQAELRFHPRGKGTKIFEPGVHFAEDQIAFEALTKSRIPHAGEKIIRDEIEGDALVIP